MPAHRNQLVALRPWKPGESGNRAGMKPRVYRHVLKLARRHGPDAIETAVSLVRDETVPPSTWLAACEFIVERGLRQGSGDARGRPEHAAHRNVDPDGSRELVTLNNGQPAPALTFDHDDGPDEP